MQKSSPRLHSVYARVKLASDRSAVTAGEIYSTQADSLSLERIGSREKSALSPQPNNT
jgi:hypothetical protein